MNLRQLKKMISEEYRYWLAEQPKGGPEAPGGPMIPPPGGPGGPPPGRPGVEVGPDDIDVMGGGDDSEATLRQIYDMLKDYFEGGAAGAPAPAGAPGAPGAPAGDEDMEDMDAGDELANSEEGDEEGDDEDKEALQERFKKLANIIKG
tara:strand:+ start:1156 stop:1599 length:444 start_codon:yes stop_codon:yes gene_type:complete